MKYLYSPREMGHMNYSKLKQHYAHFLYDNTINSKVWFDYQRTILEALYKKQSVDTVTNNLKCIDLEMTRRPIPQTPRERWKSDYRLLRLRNSTDIKDPFFIIDLGVNNRFLTALGSPLNIIQTADFAPRWYENRLSFFTLLNNFNEGQINRRPSLLKTLRNRREKGTASGFALP